MIVRVGLDFGTTNSSLAVLGEDGVPRLARFPTPSGHTTSFRSLLYFSPGPRSSPRVSAGPEAIGRYQESDTPGRLIQSLKSYLANRGLKSTNVFGKVFSLEELLGFILRSLREQAEADFGPLGDSAVVGRPVRFADSRDASDDAFALERLRRALGLAGFEQVRFVLEPTAAAHAYRTRLSRSELALIADFGGGTTDFSLARLTPLSSASPGSGVEILGTAGLPIAGDCFDGRLVSSLVAPALGHGTDYTSELGRELPVPSWIYMHLRRWHHVSFLKTHKTLQLLRRMGHSSAHRASLEALFHLIENDLGFELHRRVQATKFALSQQTEADFDFQHGPIAISQEVSRKRFEDWIAEDLVAIETTLDGLLSDCGVASHAIDAVFLTGGSCLVPAVRAIFERALGATKLRSGEELTTVAKGLALCGADAGRTGDGSP